MSAAEVFHPRREGVPPERARDQYADGKAARLWEMFVGDVHQRTQNYRDFLVGLLRKHGCRSVLDAACGTGIDSMMLVDEGFKVVSVDASDKMLKYALKARWEKRKHPNYEEWIIEEANWETLIQNLQAMLPAYQFDAVICLGNSFPHLLDEHGDQRVQAAALRNFEKCLNPGGLLVIDHRNYDAIISSGTTPTHSVYYNCKNQLDIRTEVLVVCGEPKLVTLDYFVNEKSEVRLCYYPHKLANFTRMLDDAFGGPSRATHHVYGDYKPLDQVKDPLYYIHILEKPRNGHYI